MSHWLVFMLTCWYNIQRMLIRYNKDETKIFFVKSLEKGREWDSSFSTSLILSFLQKWTADERITKDTLCIHDDHTVRCSVSSNFFLSAKVNSCVYILRLVFNNYSQLFITILRLTIAEHFRIYNMFSYFLFHKGIFQHPPHCSN